MNPIRYLAAGLLYILSAVNLYLGIISGPEESFIMYLVFSFIYFVLGMILTSRIKYAVWAGFIIPFLFLFIYPSLVDFKHLNSLFYGTMGAFDAIVVISCLILLLLEVKTS